MPFLVASVYVRPSPLPGSIKSLLCDATQFGIELRGDFNSKEPIGGRSDLTNPAGREIDAFLKDQTTLIPHLLSSPKFFRHHANGVDDHSSSILDASSARSTALKCPGRTLYAVESDHLPVVGDLALPK
jgi:hypothetical protein